MKHLAALLALVLTSCTTITDPTTGKKQLGSTLTINQRKAILSSVTALVSFVSGVEAGPGASAGVSALGNVAQAYVGKLIPSQVLTATPGVGNMGASVAPLLATGSPITQDQVNTIFSAATKLAAK